MTGHGIRTMNINQGEVGANWPKAGAGNHSRNEISEGTIMDVLYVHKCIWLNMGCPRI